MEYLIQVFVMCKRGDKGKIHPKVLLYYTTFMNILLLFY